MDDGHKSPIGHAKCVQRKVTKLWNGVRTLNNHKSLCKTDQWTIKHNDNLITNNQHQRQANKLILPKAFSLENEMSKGQSPTITAHDVLPKVIIVPECGDMNMMEHAAFKSR